MGNRLQAFVGVGGMLVALALVVVACGGDVDEAATSAPTRPPVPAATATAVPQPTATPAPTPPQPKAGGALRLWMTRDPSVMDLNRQRSSSDWAVMLPQMNWLVQLPQAKGVIGPDLAQTWTVSQDGKTHTFNLVKNAAWHDGKPVTASDIIWTFNRITKNIDGKVPSPPYKGSLGFIQDMVKADDFTVRITLSRVSASFLASIGSLGNTIYPGHVPITEFEQKRPVGSGPFVWESWKTGDSVTLKRNTSYFKKDAAGRQLPYLDGITLLIISDEALGLAAFRTGRIDFSFPHSGTVLQGKVDQLKREMPGINVFTMGAGFIYITFRSGAQPWSDVRVRRAIHLALDRSDASAALTQGEGEPFHFLEPVGSPFAVPASALRTLPCYNPDTKRADIEQAKRLLAEAGVTFQGFKSTVPVRDIYTRSGEVVIDLLNRALGTQLDLRIMDNATTQQVQIRGDFGMYVSSNSAGLVDPSATIDPFVRTGSGLNYGKWSDAEVDALLDRVDAELDHQKRVALAKDLQLKLVDLAWYVTVTSSPTSWAWVGALKNFGALINQDGPPWRFEDVWLER